MWNQMARQPPNRGFRLPSLSEGIKQALTLLRGALRLSLGKDGLNAKVESAWRGLDCNETWVDDLLQVIADDDVAIIAAHQLDRVARLDGRASELVGNVNTLAVNDVEVGDARQKRAWVA